MAGSLLAVGVVMLLPSAEGKPTERGGDGAGPQGDAAAEPTSFVARMGAILALTGPLLPTLTLALALALTLTLTRARTEARTRTPNPKPNPNPNPNPSPKPNPNP